jgi:MerR family transcriptional regulator, light-induced transcriptional regulator
MSTFTIGDLEQISGIKAHTIRAWEQRYGLLAPQRKDSNHRLYSGEDLKKLLRATYLIGQGYRISKVAAMSEKEILKLTLEEEAPDNVRERLLNRMVEAMIDYDTKAFEETLNHAVGHMGLEQAVVGVFYPFFAKAGRLWLTDHILPANEHFASHLIRHKMIVAIDGLDTPANQEPVTVLCTPAHERHEIPLLFIQYILRKHGKPTVYLGSALPAAALENYLSERPPAFLHIHMLSRPPELSADAYVTELLERFDGLHVVLSGPVSAEVTLRTPRLTLLTSLSQMMEYL